MKKYRILILGCSFTAGSYVYDESQINKLRGWGPDRLDNNIGWWYYVDYFKDKDVRIMTCPSQGYWAFFQIILTLLDTNRLTYDEIWIQETVEPRPSFIHSKIDIAKIYLDYAVNYDKRVIKNFKYTHFDNNDSLILSLGNAKPENKPYCTHEKFNLEVSETCARNIETICREKNIKGVVWSMMDPFMKCEHFTRILSGNIIDILDKENLLVAPLSKSRACHQTEEGNKHIGNLINRACIDMMI